MKHYIAMGFRGRLNDLGVNTLEEYQKKDAEIRAAKKGFPLFTPLVEFDPSQEPFHIVNTTGNEDGLTGVVRELYLGLCVQSATKPEIFYPGPFGDFMDIFQEGVNGYLRIGHKAYIKPGLAADLAIVVKGKSKGEDVYYLVTGIRGADPGKGQPAWLGGFRNVDRSPDGLFHFDSGAYTILHEAYEEGNLRIAHENPESLRRDYTAEKIPVRVSVRGAGSDNFYVATNMHFLTTIPTSDLSLSNGGETLQDGSKRVYATSGYLIMIDLKEREINEGYLKKWLTGGDDIKKLLFHDITKYALSGDVADLAARLKFGISHHNDLLDPVIKKTNELHQTQHMIKLFWQRNPRLASVIDYIVGQVDDISFCGMGESIEFRGKYTGRNFYIQSWAARVPPRSEFFRMKLWAKGKLGMDVADVGFFGFRRKHPKARIYHDGYHDDSTAEKLVELLTRAGVLVDPRPRLADWTKMGDL